MSRYRWALTGLALFAAATILVSVLARTAPPSAATGPGNAALIPTDQRMNAAEFTGLDGWLNSAPLTVNNLRGKVVLVDFWTFSCVNCVRTIPHLQHLEQAYGDRGLVIVGVHSPEFDFEKVRANVAAAVHRFGVTWPVAIDSEMNTWNAYGNQYWPAEYLIDQSGRVAYLHDGEGDYDVTESAIAALLGISTNPTPAAATPDIGSQTPELYAGSDRGHLADREAFGTVSQPTNHADTGGPYDANLIFVTGTWTDQGQYLESTSAGHVRLNFTARDVYVVAGPRAGPVNVTVTVDAHPVDASQRGPDITGSGLEVGSQQLYHVLQGQGGSTSHQVDLAVPAGFRIYTFTFG